MCAAGAATNRSCKISDRPRPQVWIVGDPNGAGKSTIVRRFNRGRLPVVNPDDIARDIDAKRINDRLLQLQAGRIALQERTRRLAAGDSFVVETTLSGHSEIALMRQAGDLGYKVNFVFVGLAKAQLSSSRVALRMARGGHDVPDEDVERRFGHIQANLGARSASCLTSRDKDVTVWFATTLPPHS